MKPTKEQIEKVAEWWAVRTFDCALNQNNGDDSEHGGLAFMMMNILSMQAKDKAPSDARGKFKAAIVERLSKGDGYQALLLDVDYHPNEGLATACKLAGIDPAMLPIKTHTQFDNEKGEFIGRYQYGGKFETIA